MENTNLFTAALENSKPKHFNAADSFEKLKEAQVIVTSNDEIYNALIQDGYSEEEANDYLNELHSYLDFD